MRKVGIDTNILLRLLVDDDPIQRKAVINFGAGIGVDYTGFVTLISILEIDWALRTQYGYAKHESADAIGRLMRIRGVEIQEHRNVATALEWVTSTGGDLADALIAHLCLDAGCENVATLDKKAAAKIAAMELIS